MKVIRNLLIIVMVAKALSLVVLWYFPGEGVNYHPIASKMPEYKRYSAQNIIRAAQRPDAESATAAAGETAYGPNISNMVLKGLFKPKEGGFIIIALKAKPDDSEVIGIGDAYQGYTLKKVLDNGALFDKHGQNYSLYFSEEAQNGRLVPGREDIQAAEEGIKQVAKSDITYYANNAKQIWEDIGIVEVKQDGNITGFKVTRIKANNKPMTSYKDAIAIYKGIDKLQALELVVLRNNQETEIVYEIY